MKNNDTFDILKYILSFMIIAIHTGGGYVRALYPWLRIAVPLFFMISAYLLFSKYVKQSFENKNILVKKYISKNLKYYFFWFFALLPLTIYLRREWFKGNALVVLLKILSNSLFSSTFVASWFIIASVWAVYFIHKMKRVKKINLLIILLYIVCCLRSSYMYLFESSKFVNNLIDIYETFFASPIFSFPIAICWMYIGKLFAEHDALKKFNKAYIFGTIVFAIGLYFEFRFVYNHSGILSNDCYFLLAPFCICIFGLVLNTRIKCKFANTLRKISIVSYPLHGSLIPIVRKVLSIINLHSNLLCFIIVVILCHLSTLIIVKLEKIENFKVLKYSH